MKLKSNKSVSARVWINGQMVVDNDCPIWTGTDGSDAYMVIKNQEDGTEIKIHVHSYTEFDPVDSRKEDSKKMDTLAQQSTEHEEPGNTEDPEPVAPREEPDQVQGDPVSG